MDSSVLLENLASIINSLSKRGSGSLEEYLGNIGYVYSRYGYMPIVYPIFAKNFSYHKEVVKGRKEAEYIVDALSKELGVEVDYSNPFDQAAAVLYWSMRLCIDMTRPGSELGNVDVSIGTARVRFDGFCDIMSKAQLSVLLMAGSEYATYASKFYMQALSDFVRKSSISKECEYKQIPETIDVLRELDARCPGVVEGFRRELTSRIITGMRGLLASLYLVKWVYNPLDIIVLERHEFMVAKGGVRSSYAAQPNYLGRLVSEALEVWMNSLVDLKTLNAFGKVILEYYRLLSMIQEEPNILESSTRKYENLYESRPVAEWLHRVKRLIQDNDSLSIVNPLRLGEVVDDIVMAVLNEKAHSIAAEYSDNPEVSAYFTRFEKINIKDLIFNKKMSIL